MREAILQVYSQRTYRHFSIKIELHFEDLPEIRNKHFHVAHVVINQHLIFGLIMRLRT